MRLGELIISGSIVACLLVAGCGKSKTAPTQPTETAATVDADAVTGSVTVPQAISPAAGAQIRNVDQPVTLVVANAVATRGTNTYDFEIATDAAFAAKVATKSGVAEGTSGRTSVTLDRLTPNADYHWRARAQAGGTEGPFTSGRRFSIGPAVTIDTPVVIGPVSGAQTGARPALRVRNATRQGPAGPITYKFDIAAASTFSPILVTATVAEGVNETGFIPAADLPIETALFWRATAIDATNAVSSAPTSPQGFTTSLAIDLSRVIVSYPAAPSGPTIAAWRQTATIGAVEQDGNPAAQGIMCISFTTSHDWPSTAFFGAEDVQVYANQWYFARIGGQWYGGPGEYLRVGRGFCKTGQGTNAIGPDGGWNTVMARWAPKPGELVGYMISTPARNWPGMRTIDERSDIVVQPWRDTSLGSTFTSVSRPR
ncbi:MAG TPA: hypothetical protein VGQ16_09100 [Vicinamibacterales bacterium]|jgi:hypothetical protein|nr:hypothetical protein [Vicinamibacterales bacterium]